MTDEIERLRQRLATAEAYGDIADQMAIRYCEAISVLKAELKSVYELETHPADATKCFTRVELILSGGK